MTSKPTFSYIKKTLNIPLQTNWLHLCLFSPQALWLWPWAQDRPGSTSLCTPPPTSSFKPYVQYRHLNPQALAPHPLQSPCNTKHNTLQQWPELWCLFWPSQELWYAHIPSRTKWQRKWKRTRRQRSFNVSCTVLLQYLHSIAWCFL